MPLHSFLSNFAGDPAGAGQVDALGRPGRQHHGHVQPGRGQSHLCPPGGPSLFGLLLARTRRRVSIACCVAQDLLAYNMKELVGTKLAALVVNGASTLET